MKRPGKSKSRPIFTANSVSTIAWAALVIAAQADRLVCDPLGLKSVSICADRPWMCYDKTSLPAKAMCLAATPSCPNLLMDKVLRAGRMGQHPGQTIISLLIAAWLMVMQPGMSYYGLINPDVHAEIDATLYGQSPSGETLPGHVPHAPHDHPGNLGTTIPQVTLDNPFGAAFYQSLLLPARRLALHGRWLEMAVSAESIVIAPPDQPPRAAA